jgi:hypothetical protein
MGWLGGIIAAAVGGYIASRFARQPWLVAILIGVFAIIGYTWIPI